MLIVRFVLLGFEFFDEGLLVLFVFFNVLIFGVWDFVMFDFCCWFFLLVWVFLLVIVVLLVILICFLSILIFFRRFVCEVVVIKFFKFVWLFDVVNFWFIFLISCKNLLLGDLEVLFILCLLFFGFKELLEREEDCCLNKLLFS